MFIFTRVLTYTVNAFRGRVFLLKCNIQFTVHVYLNIFHRLEVINIFS
jgi:hypothetical protein